MGLHKGALCVLGALAVALSRDALAAILSGDSPPSEGTITPGDTTNSVPRRVWSDARFRALPTAQLPVAGGVDLNGDAYSDLVVGGALEDDARGRVVMFPGSPAGLAQEPGWAFDGDRPNQHLGMGVSVLDINGDGVGDIVVSAVDTVLGNSAAAVEASVFVFPGGEHGLASAPSQSFRGRAGRFKLRSTVAAVGDVNGDGFADLAVDAIDPTSTVDGGNCLVVFHGSRSGLRPEPVLVFQSEQDDCNFAATFASAGDVNRDGYGDLLVAAPRYSGRRPHGGKVYLFIGSKDGLQPTPTWTSEYQLPISGPLDAGGDLLFGWGVGSAGDVNHDGFGDVLIGAWNASHGDAEEGAAFLFLGNARGLAATPAWHVEGNQSHVHLGASLRGVGDVNGDGFGDVVIGVPYASHGQKDEGVAMVFYGTKDGLATDAAWTFDGDRSNGHLGQYVGSAGDVNGDGAIDLVFAGADSATSAEPMLRVVVVSGWRDGLRFTSGWMWQKPWLTAVEQWLDRLPRRAIWSGTLTTALVVLGSLLWAQFRLRRELRRVIGENREFATTEERSRVARDMHDHLGADLTRLAAQIDRAVESKGGIPLLQFQTSVQRAVKALDELVWVTNPAHDTLEGLVSYLAETASELLEAHGLLCELDLPARLSPIHLSAQCRHHVLLIAKEALHNAVRHAGATRVRLSLVQDRNSLTLSVEDNGRGLPSAPGTPADTVPSSPQDTPRPVASNTGNGLRNMRARAKELGGSLALDSCPAGGLKVSVTFPVSDHAIRPPPGP